jgi:16S rRNA C1402 (ribose-2'-O) methylase RsmI
MRKAMFVCLVGFVLLVLPSKLHEELLVGSAAELLELLETTPVKQKGEFVMIVDSRS